MVETSAGAGHGRAAGLEGGVGAYAAAQARARAVVGGQAGDERRTAAFLGAVRADTATGPPAITSPLEAHLESLLAAV